MSKLLRSFAFVATLLISTAAEPSGIERLRQVDGAIASPWSVQVSPRSVSLVLSGGGRDQLRLVCTSGPSELRVIAPTLKRIVSEERFTLGIGDQLFTLVVDPGARPSGVAARVPLRAAFVASLGRRGEIGATYGSRNLGPLPAPPRTLLKRFQVACREALSHADRSWR